MILGIGIDLVNIERVNKLTQEFGEKFEKKIFTANEISAAMQIANEKKRAAFYAKRFAAKEAFAKACGLGLGRGIDFADIEISNDELGKPYIKIINDKIAFLLNHFKTKEIAIHLSLSDEVDMAKATVLLEKVEIKEIK